MRDWVKIEIQVVSTSQFVDTFNFLRPTYRNSTHMAEAKKEEPKKDEKPEDIIKVSQTRCSIIFTPCFRNTS